MGYLYKYRACNENTESIFTTGSLHYSHPNDFNDPYDCKVFLKKKLHIYIERIATDKIRLVPIDMNELQETIQDEINDLEVCSFSKDGLQMQMWSHYADSHKGLCLVFDNELLLERQHCDAREVIYQDKQVVNESIFPETPTEDIIRFIYTKKCTWAYEQEVRFIHKPEPEYKNGNYPFNKQALRAIYFGTNCTPQNISKYRKLCHENGFNHVRFYQIKLANSGKYELEPELI
jgi:hypothetical protein